MSWEIVKSTVGGTEGSVIGGGVNVDGVTGGGVAVDCVIGGGVTVDCVTGGVSGLVPLVGFVFGDGVTG